ncbi:MAG TPA: MarR family transcriptional regulator [Pseudonocardiaceae bacterium]|nr:MarR family transcriptional regulator [Pseudonocardiaceae bacterium]
MEDIETVVSDPERVGAALRLIIGRIARRLRQNHESGELTLSEVSVLSRLEREGASTPSALAEHERVRPQAMATTLAALEERGLLDRHPDPHDGRRVVMTLTEQGRATVLHRRSESVERLITVLENEFSAAELRTLDAALPLLDRLSEEL